MSDKIAVMRAGELEAYDTPDQLYDHPQTSFVASFIGSPPMNLLEVEVQPDGSAFAARREGLEVAVGKARARGAAGRGKVLMGVRPEDAHLGETGLPGQVTAVEPMGRETLVEVAVEGNTLRVLVEPTVRISLNENVRLTLDSDRLHFFDLETTQSLIAG